MMVFFSVDAQAAVKLSKKKIVLEKGTKYELSLYDSVEDIEEDADKWTTSNKKIVKVKNGVLTPVGVGSAKVTAKFNGKKYTCKVTVVDYTGMSIEQKKVISYALKYVGNKYRYGGTSLTNGTDCSGFTMSVYAHFGYGLPRTAAAQMQGLSSVDLSAIQPGDLLFYRGKDGSIGHVTMYIGGGQVVHASSSTTGIIVSGIGYRTPCAAARVIWD